MTEKDMNRIISEYSFLSTKVDALSKVRGEKTAQQMDRASAEMDGMKRTLLCMGLDIGKTRNGEYSIKKLTKIRK